ncbi:IS30 family transposase [Fructilactobacillus sanfranciscensis]|uniref:IS30 family transposase n=1 Tax=Fructilactobacillus sanfranciscensis TaxID=1625 RepID=UPI003B97E007
MLYKHLNFEDRVKIETLIKEGYNFSKIATIIKVSRSTITREIQKATGGKGLPNKFNKSLYYANQAEQVARKNLYLKKSFGKNKMSNHRVKVIRQKILQEKWSPEQIVYGLRNFGVSVSTIYNWINQNKIKGLNNKLLRNRGKRYKRALSERIRASYRQRKSDLNKTIQHHSIDKRLKSINNRTKFGHWELDGVESMQSNHLVLTLVERKSRFAVAILSKSKHAKDISDSVDKFLNDYHGVVKSITCDRGSEFVASLTQSTFKKHKVKYFYAHAYSPQERGTNENFNRLLREYYPKKTNFAKVSQSNLNKILYSINTRPMKRHKFKSRLVVFKRHLRYINQKNMIITKQIS